MDPLPQATAPEGAVAVLSVVMVAAITFLGGAAGSLPPPRPGRFRSGPQACATVDRMVRIYAQRIAPGRVAYGSARLPSQSLADDRVGRDCIAAIL